MLNYKKFLGKISKILRVGLLAAANQFCSLVVLIVVIRWLEKSDYAYYASYFLAYGAITLLVKSGISQGFAHEISGGNIKNENLLELFRVLTKINFGKKWLSLFVICGGFFGYSLIIRNDFSECFFSVGVLLIVCFIEVNSRLLDYVAIYSGRANALQYSELLSNLIRLAFHATLFFFGLTGVVVHMVAHSISMVLRGIFMAKITGAYDEIKINQHKLLINKHTIIITDNIYYVDLFYAMSSQFVFYYIGVKSGENFLSDYSVITRFSQVFSPISVLINVYFVPKYIKIINKSKSDLIVLFAYLFGVYILMWLFAVWVATKSGYLFGSSYDELMDVLVSGVSVVALGAMMGGVLSVINNSGAVGGYLYQIPLLMAYYCIGLMYYDGKDVLYAVLITQFAVVPQIFIVLWSIFSHKKGC